MRNLKRALSLALASVMLLGMMVVGTSAASYSDVSSEDNVEAIEVLNAVKVMIGKQGNFDPDAKVNRHEMATIMAKLYLGSEAADNYVGTHPFTDVYPWADKYVAACYENGLVSGTSKTTFGGNQPLTAIQAAAMMLRALGYEDLSKGAADWRTPVAAKANQIRLFKDVTANPGAQLTRNEVAQLALNTLKSDVVETERGADVTIGDVAISTSLKYNRVEIASEGTANYAGGTTGDAGLGYQQLCEKLYDQDLKLEAGDPDDFGRPAAHKWTYKNDDVYNVPKEATIKFTASTSEDDVLKAIKGYTFNGTKVADKTTAIGATTTAIGDLTFSAATDKVTAVVKAATGNGKLVEIFATDKAVDAVVIAAYSVGEITKISTNKDGDVTYSFDGAGSKKDFADPDKDDEIVIEGSVEEDDIVTYVDKGGVRYVYPTTSFVGAQSAFNTNKATITVDGKTYDVGTGLTGVTVDGTAGNFPNSNDDATFYVDQYGYVVKSDAVKAETNWAIVDEIVYVRGSGLSGSKYAEAKLVFPDGTAKEVKVTEINGIKMTESDAAILDVKDSDVTGGFLTTDSSKAVTKITIDTNGTKNANLADAVVKYSEKNDEYKLTYVDLAASSSSGKAYNDGKTVDVANGEKVTAKGVPGFGGNSPAASGNNDTIYVIKTGDDKYAPYTGYKNVIDVTAAGGTVPVVYVSGDSGVELVYIDASANAKTGGESGDIFYVTNLKVTTELDDEDTIYVLEGVLNGEAGELRADSTFTISAASDTASQSFSDLTEDALYEVEVDGDGYVTKMILMGADGKTYVKENMTEAKEEKSGIVAGKAYDDDTVVYVIDGDDVSEGGVKDARDGDLIYIKVKGDSGADAQTIEVMYVIKEAAPAAPTCDHATLVGQKAENYTAQKAANCVEDGNPEYWTCPACNKFFTNETTSTNDAPVIAADGSSHNFDTQNWESDAANHWHKCLNGACTAKDSEAAHVDAGNDWAGAASGTSCATCAYEKA